MIGRRFGRESLSWPAVFLGSQLDDRSDCARIIVSHSCLIVGCHNLFNEADYPQSLLGLFEVQWDFPSVEPPEYLRQLSPELYRQECQRVAARFDEAVRLAEEAFASELADLVSHLTERISGQEDGKPKVFRDSAVENLREFFDRFRKLNIGSSGELEQLVDQAQSIIRGVKADKLRDSRSLRSHVAAELASVQTALDQLLADRPRRNILRRPK